MEPNLQNILRLLYNNAKIMIDFMIHLQNCKFVLDSIHKLAYNLPKRNL